MTRTVQQYEAMGASAIFIEDQTSPKRCGHMSGKEVIPMETAEQHIRAAVGMRRSPDFFVLARTDAIQPCGVDEALRRGERYLKAGADGIYVEGPRTVEELERVGRAFKGTPLATSILEGGGKTPWLAPDQLHAMGYSMILYPTTILFQATRAIERALAIMKAGRPMPADDAVDMKTFEEIVEMGYWADIENRFEEKKK